MPQDVRRVGRVIGGMLLATGQPTEDDVARANEGLAALGRPPLTEADVVSETPETLAPLVPVELRSGVLELLYVVAGDEPIRRRFADAYAGL